jgi:hypothetical protein
MSASIPLSIVGSYFSRQFGGENHSSQNVVAASITPSAFARAIVAAYHKPSRTCGIVY